MTKATRATTLAICDDIIGSRTTIEVPLTRGELVERLLWAYRQHRKRRNRLVTFCIQFREDRIVLHAWIEGAALLESWFGETREEIHRVLGEGGLGISVTAEGRAIS